MSLYAAGATKGNTNKDIEHAIIYGTNTLTITVDYQPAREGHLDSDDYIDALLENAQPYD